MNTKPEWASLAIAAAASTSTGFAPAPSIAKPHNRTNQGRNFAMRLLSLLRSAILVAAALLSFAASAQMPGKVLACYWPSWDTSFKITDVPLDFNMIYLFSAYPDAPAVNGSRTNLGNGSFTFQAYLDAGTRADGSPAVSPADVQAVRARGQKVIFSVGGSGQGYNFTDRTKSTNFVNSIVAVINQIGGVDGLDFNNFEADTGVTPSEMVWIAQQLRATYGPNFAITAPPGAISTGGAPVQGYAMTDPTPGLTLMQTMQNAGVLTFAGPQFYEWSVYKQPGFVKEVTDQWVAGLGEQQVVVGLSANFDFANSLTLDESEREYNAIAAAHPNIRGAFAWNCTSNLQGGNAWGSAMKPLVLGSGP